MGNAHPTGLYYAYDNLNRIETEAWADGSKTFTYSYDKNGNRLTADDGKIKYVNSYDKTDLLETVDRFDDGNLNPKVRFNYEYDEIGNLTQTKEVVGTAVTTTLYEYDDPRYLNTKITQTGAGLANKEVKFTYNATGENTKIERYLDGLLKVTTDNAYDIYGRLTGIAHVKGITPTNPTGTPISDDVYVLDNLNRLQAQTKGGQVKEIGYDKTDQVQTVTGGAGEAYTYDLNGNRTNGGYTTGVDNRLTSDGTYSYLYDPEGNRQSRTKISDGAVDEYTWDYRNRLTGIVSKDSGGAVIKTVGYTYDVDDQRVSKTVTTATGSTTEKYYLDGNQIAFVTDGAGNQMFHYLYGLNVDQVMAQDSPAGMVWALADRLGSVDTLTDGEGVVVDKRTFDSFGRVLSETNPSVSFRYGYTGRELDLESGLNYYRARYYDSQVGRFISVDPMGFGAGDTNLYRYVGNGATNATDPSGLYSFDDFGRDAGNFGQSIGRNFDYSFDAINSNVFTPVGNAVIKPVVNAINTNFITPFNNAASNAVSFYTDLVNEGQREGGVVGTFKQGAGIFGGTLAGTPGAVGSFAQNNSTRIGGLFQAIGGAGEIYAGATTSATVFGAPVGALLAANGVDNFQAGLRKLFTGEDANTLLYDATKRLTGSDKLAGTVDAATGLVLNAAAASAAAQRAADRALAAEVKAINQGERAAEKAFLKTQCFIAGTEIQTINGTKNIEDIHVGDWVLSDDPNTVGEIEYKQVLNTFVKDTSSLVDIYIDGEKITTTEEHPFWVPNLGWVAAKDLHAGTLLQTKYESWLDVDKVELHGGLTTVYNFEVEGFHTYFVSELGLLVHNTCIDPGKVDPGNVNHGEFPRGEFDPVLGRNNPTLEGNQYHPNTVNQRREQWKNYVDSLFDPKDVATELGYTKRIPAQKAPFNSHGQTVFFDGKNYISLDIDSHNVTNGWKMFNKQGKRIGTYSSDLTTRLKD